MNEKEAFQKLLQLAKESSKKRNFSQSYELIINFQDLDLKKPEEQVDQWVALPHGTGKTVKIAAFVGPELLEQAKTSCDTVILASDFERYDNKTIKKTAQEHTHFIAQATIMPAIAKAFGKVLGPRGKMPNPKAGAVVAPTMANLKPLVEKLKKTIRASARTQPSLKCAIGTEKLSDEQVLENILAVYTTVVRALPMEKENIKSVILKTTMGKPRKLEEVTITKEKKK